MSSAPPSSPHLAAALDGTGRHPASWRDRERLDALTGQPYTCDARIFTGTPFELGDLLQELHSAGLTGVRLRPAVAGHDLPAVTRGLVPGLQRRGAFRRAYEAGTLRGHPGPARPDDGRDARAAS